MATKRKSVNEEVRRFWRWLDPKISLGSAWADMCARRAQGRAMESTVEALMYQLRKGTGALADPAAQRWLAELNEAQLLDVAARLQKFKPMIAPAWTPRDIEILIAVRNGL